MHTSDTLPQQSPTPLFRFLQVNDLHVQDAPIGVPGVGGYPLANERARWLLSAINRGQLGPLPAFVLGVGDMVHGQDLGRIEEDFLLFRSMIQKLRCPFFPAVGNHEVAQQEHSDTFLRPYRDAFGADAAQYYFEHGGILFIVANNSGGEARYGGERCNWLREVLETHPHLPKILCCHVPLVPMRDETVLARSFGFPSYKEPHPGMLQLVDEYSGSFIAVLSGHLHLTGAVMRHGVAHICLSGTASFPSDGAFSFQVYEDRIEVACHPLPQALAHQSPTIHGAPRHPHSFTDTLHPTPEEYQCGLPSERHFVLHLGPAKQPRLPLRASHTADRAAQLLLPAT